MTVSVLILKFCRVFARFRHTKKCKTQCRKDLIENRKPGSLFNNKFTDCTRFVEVRRTVISEAILRKVKFKCANETLLEKNSVVFSAILASKTQQAYEITILLVSVFCNNFWNSMWSLRGRGHKLLPFNSLPSVMTTWRSHVLLIITLTNCPSAERVCSPAHFSAPSLLDALLWNMAIS